MQTMRPNVAALLVGQLLLMVSLCTTLLGGCVVTQNRTGGEVIGLLAFVSWSLTFAWLAWFCRGGQLRFGMKTLLLVVTVAVILMGILSHFFARPMDH